MDDAKKNFYEHGFVILQNLIPVDKLERYKTYYEENNHLWKNTKEEMEISGWEYSSEIHTKDKNVYDFLNAPELKSVIAFILDGKEPKLHLSLIPWFSVGQSWHFDSVVAELFGVRQDHDYNLEHSGHVGAWIALDVITVESGPFGYIPDSNNFDYLNDKTFLSFKNEYEEQILIKNGWSRDDDLSKLLSSQEISAKYTEMIYEFTKLMLSSGFFKEKMFLASPGDVLFWSGKTIHCAHRSTPGFLRKNIIGHYHQ